MSTLASADVLSLFLLRGVISGRSPCPSFIARDLSSGVLQSGVGRGGNEAGIFHSGERRGSWLACHSVFTRSPEPSKVTIID